MEKINPYQIEKYREGLKYPAKKEDIINRVTRNGAVELNHLWK